MKEEYILYEETLEEMGLTEPMGSSINPEKLILEFIDQLDQDTHFQLEWFSKFKESKYAWVDGKKIYLYDPENKIWKLSNKASMGNFIASVFRKKLIACRSLKLSNIDSYKVNNLLRKFGTLSHPERLWKNIGSINQGKFGNERYIRLNGGQIYDLKHRVIIDNNGNLDEEDDEESRSSEESEDEEDKESRGSKESEDEEKFSEVGCHILKNINLQDGIFGGFLDTDEKENAKDILKKLGKWLQYHLFNAIINGSWTINFSVVGEKLAIRDFKRICKFFNLEMPKEGSYRYEAISLMGERLRGAQSRVFQILGNLAPLKLKDEEIIIEDEVPDHKEEFKKLHMRNARKIRTRATDIWKKYQSFCDIEEGDDLKERDSFFKWLATQDFKFTKPNGIKHYHVKLI